MSFTSFEFWLLVAVCVTGYYLFPARIRWTWLLGISGLYYAAAGPGFLLYLLFTVLTSWLGGMAAVSGKKAAVALPLLLDFGMLAWLKYTNFLISCLNHFPGISLPYLELLLPLGISFYTFQSAGYLLDVYWKRCEPERNPAKLALFISFFPQLMQGPIGRYQTLSPQLTQGHSFDDMLIWRGICRITWGLMKKIVLADNAALYVNQIFGAYTDIRGLGFQGVLMYSVQLYADFSGGIDIALGIAEMMGIRLDENFRQPFFAQTLTDFWHRWHITLGTWMKDYVFYPITLSEWMRKLRQRSRKWFGREIGKAFCIGIANVIIFVVVGIWHGPAWHYIAYGLYNGLIIAAGGFFTGSFRKWKKSLGITDQTAWFRGFRMLRTFLIVNISWFLDRSVSLGQAWQMFTNSFGSRLWSVTVIDPSDPEKCMVRFLTIAAGCAVLLTVSILREKGKDVRGMFLKLPWWGRILLLTGAMLLCALYGNMDDGGFIYANF